MKPNEAESKYIKLLSRKSGTERLKIGAKLYEMAKKIIESAIKEEYPKIKNQKLLKIMRDRFL